MKKVIVVLGAVVAAVAASACCILPLILGVASAGTLGLSAALTPYRPYLIGLTLLILGVAFYLTYRPAKGTACATEGECARGTAGASRVARVSLWAVAAFTLAIMAYPQIAAERARSQMSTALPVPASAALWTATFAVSKMDCAACSGQIVTALKKTPGVYDAHVDFAAKRAAVRYDPIRVSVPQVLAVIDGVGFPATEVTTR